MYKCSVWFASLSLLFVTYSSHAADFEVGDREISVARVHGDAAVYDNGRKVTGLINSELKSGVTLHISPSSEVWLKVMKKGGGETSFLRLSSGACGSVCRYDSSSGVVSTSALDAGGECARSQTYHDRAREIVGLPKQDSSNAETLVTFTSLQEDIGDAGQQQGGGEPREVPTPQYQMPPAVSSPATPGGIDEEEHRGYVPESETETSEEKGLIDTKTKATAGKSKKTKSGGTKFLSIIKRQPDKGAVQSSKISAEPSAKESLKSGSMSTSDILNLSPNQNSYIPGSTNSNPPGSGGSAGRPGGSGSDSGD